ncbi:MAG: glycoside hydrolase family 3 C-terminal domain-containing protein [Nocardiopsaceae bacterium]|nr:glycoside hydrolase family 3 C-terminal domain-containing protein [Nocardiopsaceae bacterium]
MSPAAASAQAPEGSALAAVGSAAHNSAAHDSARPGSATCPWTTSRAPVDQRVSEVMAKMTLADKITMVEGHGTSNPYVFYTPAIPSLCIPAVGLEDGPAGVADGLTGVTQLPAGVSLAATWDPSLAKRYGSVIGAEEAGKGASANLGPTVNIDRDPRWGRSFESLSEDPYLNGQLDVPEIDGIQSQGVEDQVKHYDAYNQETYRNTPADNVTVSGRALHEIYMPSFYDAVTRGHAASVMCAYSYINSKPSCGDSATENTVLRDEWGFGGFVMSDYGAVHGTGNALDGTDQEQPENTYFGTPLETDVENGTIPVSAVNTMVQHVLTEMFRFNLFSQPRTGSTTSTVTTPEHQGIADEVAEAGTTLLKNDHSALPLSGNGSVAVIGPSASASPTYAGGGSAYVIPSATTSPLDGIKADDSNVSYAQGLPSDTALPAISSSDLSPAYPSGGTPSGGSYTGTLTAPETGTYVLAITNPCGCYSPTYLSLNGKHLIDDPSTPPVHTYSAAVHLVKGQSYTLSVSGQSSQLLWATPSDLAPGIASAVAAAKKAQTAVVVVSDDTESEATDRPSLNLPSAQDELVQAVAAANPNTVVVVDAGAPVAMPWLDKVAGVVDAWYPGQTSGTALASVLFGHTDPGGHLPVTFPSSLGQVPASTTAQWPGNGKNEVDYSEGVDVGYRWYDAKDKKPMFPFGYGLSYTSFHFSDLHVSSDLPGGRSPASPGSPGPVATGTSDVRVSAVVTNTGSRAGSDVAQLYTGDPPSTGEPPRQLEGFQKVTLQPGQSKRVSFTLTPAQLSWWDDSANGWTQSPGRYQVYVGDSSALANLPLRGSFAVPATPGNRQVSVSAPSTVAPGQPSKVTVTLGAGGNETLPAASLALQLPQGWTATPDGPTTLRDVAPGQPVTATFTVTPPADAPNASAVVHATATMGAATRENGATVTVTG